MKDDEGQSQKGHKRDKEKKLERCFLQQAGQCECEESETVSHVVSYRKRYSSHRRKRLRDSGAAEETFFFKPIYIAESRSLEPNEEAVAVPSLHLNIQQYMSKH